MENADRVAEDLMKVIDDRTAPKRMGAGFAIEVLDLLKDKVAAALDALREENDGE